MDGGDGERSTVAVLHVGGMHFGSNQQAGRVGDDMPLAALDFLRRIETARSASLSGLITLAEGFGSRPAASRACTRSSKLIRSSVPSSRHP
jgi:hypothetical protein